MKTAHVDEAENIMYLLIGTDQINPSNFFEYLCINLYIYIFLRITHKGHVYYSIKAHMIITKVSTVIIIKM